MSVPSETLPAGGLAPRDTRGTIPLLLLAAFVVILNETILNMALSRLMSALQIGPVTVQWLSTVFMLTMAVVIPITGFLLQRFRTRAVFLTAMGLFCTGTLIALVSPGFHLLLVARVVQASGTAVMMPLLMTTILVIVPHNRRGVMMGNISIVMAVAPAIGPTVSGIILQWLSWRWIFGIVLIIALGVLTVGFLKLKNVSETRTLPIDVGSVILSAFGFGGLVYALSKIGGGPGDQLMIFAISLTVGVIGLAAFVWRQIVLQRRDAPLLDLRTFSIRTFRFSLGAMMLGFAALIGAAILLPIFLQQVRGLGTLPAGLMLLPGGLLMGLMGPVVGRLYDRMGPRPLTIPGAIIVVVALAGFTQVGATTPIWLLMADYTVLMGGLGLMFTPLFTSGLNSLPSSLYSHGSALVGTLQQVAGAAGTALLVTVMALGAAGATRRGAGEVASLTTGIHVAMGIAALMSVATVVLVAFIGKERTEEPTPVEAEPDQISAAA